MKRFLNRWAVRAAVLCFCGACVAGATSFSASGASAADEAQAKQSPDTLTIGSQAPALDVEHWLHAEEGKREPVTDFEKGKIYVVEFWATWCGPCISSMPHLAELQQEYKDQGVRIVSISDEDLETVEAFLKRDTPQDEDVTFAELTSAYSLTTDPDGSAYADYMQAANQPGIPTAFVVGKTGQVEWIGHPMRLDGPLEALVNDSWDRAAFAKQFKETQANELAQSEAMRLLREGKTAEAIALLDERIKATTAPESLAMLQQYKMQVLLSDPEMKEEAATAVKEILQKAEGDASQVYQGAAIANHLSRGGHTDEELVSLAVEKLRPVIEDEDLEPAAKPVLYDMLARLLQVQGKLDDAIAAEQQAVKLANGPMKNRFQSFLDDLQKEAKGEDQTEPAAKEDSSGS